MKKQTIKMLKSKFKQLITFQFEREEYEMNADKIQKVSAFCQLPRPFFEELDKAVEIGEKQAEIWNEIRGFILQDDKTTIWQFAIKSNFPIKYFGEESFLNLGSEELNLIQVEIK